VLSPDQILDRLEQRLPLLTGGARDVPERQQTLRATIDWSYELLDEHAQRLFARLAVFAGSFSLDSAAEICDADLDGLAALVELALLKPIGEDRFLTLETIGEYARERLKASGEHDSLRDRHAQHFLAFVPRMHSPGRPEPEDDEEAFGVAIPLRESLDRVEAEYANVRAALQWLIASGRAEQALRLTHALTPGFLMSRGRRGEIRPLLDSALARADKVSPRARTDALTTLAVYAPDLDPAARRELAAEGLALARRLEDTPRIQRALRTLARYQDDPGDRQTMLLECEALARELDDRWALGWTQFFLGELAIENGDYEEAQGRLEEALALFEGFSAVLEVPQSLAVLGFIALLVGRAHDAEQLFRRSLERVLELDAPALGVDCVEGLASVAVENGEAARAVRLLGASASVREDLDEEEVAQYHRRMRNESLARARERLGDRFDREWEAGRSLAYDEATALALADY
jgi:tetratricopeptide (TPR) repeat protein